jgi:prepilin-type N-terminal cleavage/methylation domain-containing protein
MLSVAKQNDERAFTLIELVIVIVITGIIATVATRKMTSTLETARMERTVQEMDHFAYAMVGNPDLQNSGARTDFGYVGDVGSLPPSLDALRSNPGGYSTWNGPYISEGVNASTYGKDAWGSNYIYNDTLLRSVGSGSDIDRLIAANTDILLRNRVAGFVLDANNEPPGGVYRDSVVVMLMYPDGTGGTAAISINPGVKGNFTFTNIPIGNHALRVIYIPQTDTVTWDISVRPAGDVKLALTFPADLW